MHGVHTPGLEPPSPPHPERYCPTGQSSAHTAVGHASVPRGLPKRSTNERQPLDVSATGEPQARRARKVPPRMFYARAQHTNEMK